MSGRIKARIFNGTRDLMPEEMIPRQKMLRVMTTVFERFGFAPLETPVMEFMEVLQGKYGAEGDKLIYPLAYKGGKTLGLRFDLTVPLSRLVAMRPELTLPFKRYQIQPVYRGDRPQPAQGRFREFYQCDVDTVGTASLIADAENIAVCYEIYRELGLLDAGLIMRINNRKVLRALVEAAGLDAGMDNAVCTALDKIDKIGREKVEELLGEAGVDAEARRKLFDLIDLGEEIGPTEHRALIEALTPKLAGTSTGAEGLLELQELFAHLDALGVPAELLYFDLVLTRGLDYYTGPIYEFRITALENFGSLGGGGRYDDLLSLYGAKETPATGVSIGLSRVQSALEKLGRLKPELTATKVMVLRLEDLALSDQLGLVSTLRKSGLPTEIYYDLARFKKQIAYADKRGIPYVLIQGPKELERGVVQLKDIRIGVQNEMPLSEVVAFISAQDEAGELGTS
ncbi:MAG: histidine--tRNA ligase [Planctomycetota bacterium]